MPRAIWKGAISFGLVHIPVALVSATSSSRIDFDWLDKRSMDPVGYQRINKVTGKVIEMRDIVKGVKYDSGQYVIISDKEIKEALPQLTQTIDIFSFVEAEEIPLTLYDTPYYLTPERRGEKVYALLRETLKESGRVALAHVVIRTKQHLAALMASGDALTLMLLRWPSDVRSLATLELDGKALNPKLNPKEKAMARALVDEMTGHWDPEEYRDTFTESINDLIEQKARAGRIETVSEADAEPRRSAEVIDIAELLKRSLSGGKGKSRGARAKSGESATKSRRSPRSRSAKGADTPTPPPPKGRGPKGDGTRAARHG